MIKIIFSVAYIVISSIFFDIVAMENHNSTDSLLQELAYFYKAHPDLFDDTIYQQLLYKVRSFKKEGAQLHKIANREHLNCLYSPIRHNHLEIVQLLVDMGASVNAANQWGETSLHFAIRLTRLNPPIIDIVRFLLRKQASINTKDNEARSPLALAAEQPHNQDLISLLLSYFPEITIDSHNHCKELDVAARFSPSALTAIFYYLLTTTDLHNSEAFTTILQYINTLKKSNPAASSIVYVQLIHFLIMGNYAASTIHYALHEPQPDRDRASDTILDTCFEKELITLLDRAAKNSQNKEFNTILAYILPRSNIDNLHYVVEIINTLRNEEMLKTNICTVEQYVHDTVVRVLPRTSQFFLGLLPSDIFKAIIYRIVYTNVTRHVKR